MTTISEIKKKPINVSGQPEEMFQAYHILQKVISLLEIDTPNEVILEIISECRSEHGQDLPPGWVQL